MAVTVQVVHVAAVILETLRCCVGVPDTNVNEKAFRPSTHVVPEHHATT